MQHADLNIISITGANVFTILTEARYESSPARSQSIDSLETALKNPVTIQGKIFFLPQVQKSVFSLIQLCYGLYFYLLYYLDCVTQSRGKFPLFYC